MDGKRQAHSAGPSGAPDRRRIDPHELPPPDAIKIAFAQIAELLAYATYFIGAKLDRLKLTFRRALILAAIGVIGLIALGAVMVMAIALMCAGLAQLFTAWFGGRQWAGNLVVGILLVALISGGVWFGAWYLTRRSRMQTVQKYELRRKQQRASFGHDVEQRARENI